MVRQGPVALAVLAVLALGVGAAALDSAAPGSLGGDGGGSGPGDRSTFSLGGLNSSVGAAGDGDRLQQKLFGAVTFLLFAAAIVSIVLHVYREGLTGVAKIAVVALFVAIAIVGLLWLLRALEVGVQPESTGLLGGGEPSIPGGGGESPEFFERPSVVLLVLLGAAVLAAWVAAVRSTGSAEPSEPEEVTTTAAPSTGAVGEAAGRAADRIENDATVGNAVYRAWREMTGHLDLPRRTTTPGEFEAAAVEAGMDPEDVRELTELFEATRYGGVEPSEEREARAVAALRRIEREYAPDEPGTQPFEGIGADDLAGTPGDSA